MSITEDVSYLLHKIKVKLYPSFLPGTEGKYMARASNEKSLTIEDICNAMKTRGGYDGDYAETVAIIRRYYEEMAYQICDGYSINNGYYALYPNIGGLFNSEDSDYDPVKNPIGIRFSPRYRFRKLLKNIAVEVVGKANTTGRIIEFYDYDVKESNTIFVPGDQFALTGDKIKLVGTDPGVGVFFVPVEDPSKAVKVTRLAENTHNRITGIAPDTNYLLNRIEVRTQFSNAKKNLKVPRIITSNFVLETA